MGVLNDSNVGIDVSGVPVAGSSGSPQDLLGFLDSTLSDKPPGRLGRKVDNDDEDCRPDPLETITDSPSPRSVVGVDSGKTLINTAGKETSETPTDSQNRSL